MEYVINKSPVEVRLSAGEHILYTEVDNTKQQETVFIEDGIKLGGGTIKKAYVFDNSPWCFVVLNDRTYIYNLVSQKTRLEYNLCPGIITPLGGNYFLFCTGDDYSIFDADSHSSILDFQHHIYSNDHIVAYEDDGKLVIRNYRSYEVIRSIASDAYSFDSDILYIYEDKKFKRINLLTDEEEYIKDYRRISNSHQGFCMFKYAVIDFNQKFRGQYRYQVIDLINDNTIMIEIPVPIRKVGTHTFLDDDIEDNLPDNIDLSFHLQLHKDYIDLLDVYIEQDKLFCNYKLCTYAYSQNTWYCAGNSYRTMELTTSCEPFEDSFKTEKNNEHTPAVPSFSKAENSGLLLGKSESGEIYITQKSDSHLYIYYKDQSQGVQILDTLDTSSYLSAYFSSDGNTIVFKKSDKTIGTLGLNNLEEDTFEIEGFTMPDKIGVNGYLPNWEGHKGGKPVWIDPITLQPVRDLNSKVYKSPDGKFIARNNFVHEHFNLLTNKVVLIEEVNELRNRLDFYYSAKDEVKEQKKEERRKYVTEIGLDKFYKLCDSKYPGIRDSITEKNQGLSDEKIEILVRKRYDDKIEFHIKCDEDFTSFFIPRKYYLVYKNVATDMEYKVFLGYNVWFLNYVSFSYDSKYLAFAAKFKEGSGVFGLYDIINGKDIIRYEKTPLDTYTLKAVWMSLFSKNGYVAFYDSRANAYIMNMNDPNTLRKASGKSVMTFSPSGKYIALSDQNYICGVGHQPSSNVFIHEVNNIETEIVRYNDVGTGFKGAMTGNTVASVAFSSDENRLLMVGSDGVIVIRNLTLNDMVDIRKTESLPYFFMSLRLPQDIKIVEVKDEMGNN